jgi:hypothetical protein
MTIAIRWGGIGATLGMLALVIGTLPAQQKTIRPETATPQATEFFENKIRPLLFNRCYSCHSDKNQQGGLRLDGREQMLKGGGHGAALVAGDPDKSLLIQAVNYTGALKMPPTGKINADESTALTAWVKMGAPWPAGKGAQTGAAPLTDPRANFWSFRPIKKSALPPVKDAAWCRNPIDRFILAKLEAKGLKSAPQADRHTLLRRVTFDLIGLPPTPQEVDAFLADRSPLAYAKVVDRLLADPRYGERWGRHWLDVARYADTKGYVFVEDAVFHNAYNYRDYVIRAFNEDLPYDQFIVQQLAADRLPQGDDRRSLAALGFLTLGRRFLNDPVLINDDRIDVTCRGLMGLTVGCARCHDHKFDPIPNKDYYSLYGVFASAHETTAAIVPKSVAEPYERAMQKINEMQEHRNNLIRGQVTRLREMVKAPTAKVSAEVKAILQQFNEDALPNPDQYNKLSPLFEAAPKKQIDDLQAQVTMLEKTAPPVPEQANALADNDQPFDPYVFMRGNPDRHGDTVPRQFLAVLSGPERKPWQDSGRLELAQAIASKDNPLTARVLVNRVWLYHFGYGIVRTPSDFGTRGEPPTHPELLDWLAATFTDPAGSGAGCGWSIKKLHRLILLSAAYQQSSEGDPRFFATDPENRLLWKQNRQRLDLEAFRDSLLFAAGRLDTKIGGPAVELTTAPFTTRRTVYGFIDRQNLQGLYRTFDFATPDSSSAQRYHTTVPQQALFMLNSPFVVEQAQQLAASSELQEQGTPARVRWLYRRLYGRVPTPEELALAVAFLKQPDGAEGTATAPVWQYGYGGYDDKSERVTAFTPFQHHTENTWQAGPKIPADDPHLGYVSLTAMGGHPGRDTQHAAIRRWTSPLDGTLTITGKLTHPADQGDGVHARLVSSREGMLAEWTAFHTSVDTNVENIHVKKGDTLDFVVDCRTNDGFDSFIWAPVLRANRPDGPTTAALGPNLEWNAAADFETMQAARHKPLTRWEQYIQTLLMTNEFSFID